MYGCQGAYFITQDDRVTSAAGNENAVVYVFYVPCVPCMAFLKNDVKLILDFRNTWTVWYLIAVISLDNCWVILRPSVCNITISEMNILGSLIYILTKMKLLVKKYKYGGLGVSKSFGASTFLFQTTLPTCVAYLAFSSVL